MTDGKTKYYELHISKLALISTLRFEVLTALKMSILVKWVVTPCGLVGRYQRFGGTYCLHRQW
jgi:hypothetical protein